MFLLVGEVAILGEGVLIKVAMGMFSLSSLSEWCGEAERFGAGGEEVGLGSMSWGVDYVSGGK